MSNNELARNKKDNALTLNDLKSSSFKPIVIGSQNGNSKQLGNKSSLGLSTGSNLGLSKSTGVTGSSLRNSRSNEKLASTTNSITQRLQVFSNTLEENAIKHNEDFSAIEAELRKNILSVRDAFQTARYVREQSIKALETNVSSSISDFEEEIKNRLAKLEEVFIVKASELRSRLNAVATKSEKMEAEKYYENILAEQVIIPYTSGIKIATAEFLNLKAETVSNCTQFKDKDSEAITTINAKVANSYQILTNKAETQLNQIKTQRENNLFTLRQKLDSTFAAVNDEVSYSLSSYQQILDNIKHRVAAEIKIRNQNEEQIINAMDQVFLKIQDSIAALVEKRKKEQKASLDSLSIFKSQVNTAKKLDISFEADLNKYDQDLYCSTPPQESTNPENDPQYINLTKVNNEVQSTVGALKNEISNVLKDGETGISQFGVSVYDDEK